MNLYFIALTSFHFILVKNTHASRLVRSSQNLSQNVERFLIRNTLVLRVRGRVPPLLLPDIPVAMLCSEAELFPTKPMEATPAPNPSDWDSDRCIPILTFGEKNRLFELLLHGNVANNDANLAQNVSRSLYRSRHRYHLYFYVISSLKYLK